MFLPKHNSNKKGFTLIELLIVIGILGILAVGLLAAVDPLEQLRKGRDANRKRAAAEYQQAAVRYYTTQGVPPWGAVALAQGPVTATETTTTTLVNSGELKASFPQAAAPYLTGTYQLVRNGTATGDLVVCFDPESKAESTNYTQLYTTNSGVTPGTAAACTTTGTCHFCIK